MPISSSLPLSFNPPFLARPQSPAPPGANQFPFQISKTSQHSVSVPLICFSLSSNDSNYESEEARWLREEQRWLREEQRWLRQESRWHAERESLLREISALEFRVQELERRKDEIQGASVSEAVAKIAALLTANRIGESGSSAVPMVVDTTAAESGKMEEEEEVMVVVKEVVGEGKKEVKEVKKRTTLRQGSEGEDVRVMQEALQKLGFYSGEEDMEYSSFSSGTVRAVKTWQASLGAPEDGIMTVELQERLYNEQQLGHSGFTVDAYPKGNDVTALPKESVNGAAFTSIMEFSEIQQTVVEEEGFTEVDVSEKRVFLLGENRWEEPSRLTGKNKQVGGPKSKDSTKCLTCRGEGRLLCTECDGTGEPNIEPQFLEWVGEEANCPYCEGHGYTICDVCEGKTLV
ncbi:hypothetical protein U1Q18_030765 [Sarracenia purpurea var. burkii]